MSIQSEVSRLNAAKSDLASAITAKGVTVPGTTKLDGYAALVEQIEAGGGGAYDITATDNGDGTQSLAIADAAGGEEETYTVTHMGMIIYTGSAGDIVNLSIGEALSNVMTTDTLTNIPFTKTGWDLIFVLPHENVRLM